MGRDKAFEADEGFLISGASFIGSGTTSPVGNLASEAGDVYIHKTGTKPVFFLCTGTGVNDWRQIQVADLINVLSFENHTTTLNGTDTLTVSSVTLHVLNGTATGYSVILPDATTLNVGRRFEVFNNSSETIFLKDDGGNVLNTLIAGDTATATLNSNGTANGTWTVTLVTSAASGIQSYSVGSDTLFSTTSATDVLITGMTVTPVSGRYACYYSADITITQNNKLSEVVFYLDGTAVTRTRRTVQGVGSNFRSAHIMLGEITVNGSQAIDVRVNIDSGTVDVNQRRMILIRLGT